eukprot:gnl/TRDRNA2_/TRDRNA2_136035_c0_seq2.p1 gnl/TRDRNA2_/TRDRNA2_136035_c0~~gnl/TRDRNA2_/TRDRNA2_136035_c0_seq2.p1  ORF type:complete len:409 (+),score=53.77 gnl/TRDRNA2_/TRDRNA2_136035_c0_seq2:63-1289(+)
MRRSAVQARRVPHAWRQHADELYELLVIERLDSPALAVEWFPWCSQAAGRTRQSLLFGTDGGQRTRSYLCTADIWVSDENAEAADEVRVTRRVNHAGAVCSVAYNAFDPYFAATATTIGDILVFNLADCPTQPPLDGHCKPGARLQGHSSPARCVAWSPHQDGLLLSAALDGRLCLWDVKGKKCSKDLAVPAIRTINGAHATDKGGAEAAAFHRGNQSIIGSVGGDGRYCTWDTRMPGDAPVTAVEAHRGGALTLAFPSEHAAGLVATGGRDQRVKLWDLRRPGSSINVLAGHTGDVLCVRWSRQDVGLLASSSTDRRVLLWDPRRAGMKVAGEPNDPKKVFAPELVFMHDAHEAPVPTVAWAAGLEGHILASADVAGTVHIWQVAENLLEEYKKMTPGAGLSRALLA